jgi:hypothetical protein
VQALPEQRHCLGAVKQPGLDPRAAQRPIDLVGEAQTLDRRLAVGLPRRLAARAGGERAELGPGVLDHRLIRHGDPPPGGDGGLLGAGRGDHRLGGGAQQSLASLGQRRLAIGPVLLGGGGGGVSIGGQGLVDRDRVGLGVDDQALPVWDQPAEVREGTLDLGQRAVFGGDRVGDLFALDQSHVAAVGGHDQPVRLDQRDGEHVAERSDATHLEQPLG